MRQCNQCGSNNVTCDHEYYTTGGDMEHVEWTHTCQDCGHVDTALEMGCFGYDNLYQCTLGGCENKYQV